MLCKTHVGALRVAADIVLDLITSHVTAGGPNSEARPEAAHALFARLPALAHHVSPDGIILCATDGWLDAFGYARSEVDGHRLAEFLTRDAAAALLTSPPFSIAAGPLDFVTAQGAVRALLVESRAAGDGPDADTLLVCRPAAGRLDAAVSIDDQLASALSDERQLRMTLLDHMSDAMVRTDAQGRVIALNAAAERFLQVDSTRARHRTLADILPVRDP
ncbi:MAG: PAS domain-containing protein, partial [Pseudomonadota bacterium]